MTTEPYDLEKASVAWIKTLLRPIDELELCVPCAYCLQNARIRFVGGLVQLTEEEMLQWPRFSRKNLANIKYLVSDMGLSLGMKFTHWPEVLERAKRTTREQREAFVAFL